MGRFINYAKGGASCPMQCPSPRFPPSKEGEEGDEEELRNNLAAHTSVSQSVTQPGEVEAVKSVAHLK